MRTSARATDPTHYDSGVSTAGQNFYSLRVGRAVGDNGVDGTGMTIFARGRLPIYANADAATIQRVPAVGCASSDSTSRRTQHWHSREGSLVRPRRSRRPTGTVLQFDASAHDPSSLIGQSVGCALGRVRSDGPSGHPPSSCHLSAPAPATLWPTASRASPYPRTREAPRPFPRR